MSSTDLKTPPTGFEGNLTPAQAEALEALKKRVMAGEFADDLEKETRLDGDRFLLRFLRATMKDKSGERIFQVSAAEERLIHSFKWRREVGGDQIRIDIENGGPMPEKHDLFRSLYPCLDVINEETGVLVRFLRFGRFISTTDPSSLTPKQWVMCFANECFYLEAQLRKLSKKHGREIGTYAVVSDLAGLSIIGVAQRISFIKMMAAVLTDNFPEMMSTTLLVNAPTIASAGFNLVKPFVDKDIQSKFSFWTSPGTDAIAKLIPLNTFPKEYGGTSDVVLKPVLADLKRS